MARGKRPTYTLDEQLEMITIDIENTEKHLLEIKQKKEILIEKIKQSRLSALDELISQSGKSIEEIMEMIGCKEEVA